MGDVFDVVGRAAGWIVLRNEAEVSNPYAQREHAERRRDKLEKDSQKTTRACMTCRQHFTSDGIHNRMCGSCRSKTEGMV